MSTAPIYKPLEIEVTDFGPIAKAKLDLRPLTVFVGPSNTGKSYLAMLIYALHQVFGEDRVKGLDQGRLLRRSTFYRFGRAWAKRDEISDDEMTTLLDWLDSLISHTEGSENVHGLYSQLPDPVAAIIRPVLRDVDDIAALLDSEIARCFGGESTECLIRYGSHNGSRVVIARKVSEDSYLVPPYIYEFSTDDGEPALYPSIPDSSPLHICNGRDSLWGIDDIESLGSRLKWVRGREGSERHLLVGAVINEILAMVSSSILSPLDRMAHYLPADRAGVMHAHRVVVTSLIQSSSRAGLQRSEPLPALSGVLADFLEQLIGIGELPQLKRKSEFDNRQRLENEILRGEVREKQSPTGYPVFSYLPTGSKDEIPLMRASSMVSELAPVVLYLRHLVEPGDVLIIEEPESHLHPGMQAAFTRQLAAVVRSGVRVMLTTHSDYVLEELANLVRMSELPESQQAGLEGADLALKPEEVGVWLFEPKKRPKGTVVKEIKLDKDAGTFPAGYGDVTEALYNKWVEVDSRIQDNKPSK